MEKFLVKIKKLKIERERNFLLDAFEKEQKYIAQNDKQALTGLIIRLNGLYDGLSEDAQQLTKLLIQNIQQEENRIWAFMLKRAITKQMIHKSVD